MRAKLILPFLILYLPCHLLSVQGHVVDTVNPGSDKKVASSQVYIAQLPKEFGVGLLIRAHCIMRMKKGTINKTYIGYIDIHGNIKAMQYDFKKKNRTRY